MSLLYKPFKQSLLTQSPAVVLGTDTLRLSLAETTVYTAADTHQFKSQASTLQNASGALASVTNTNGVHDFADPTFVTVPTGHTANCCVEWADKGGADTANPLIAYVDGFSVVTNGGDVTLVLDNGANRFFAL